MHLYEEACQAWTARQPREWETRLNGRHRQRENAKIKTAIIYQYYKQNKSGLIVLPMSVIIITVHDNLMLNIILCLDHATRLTTNRYQRRYQNLSKRQIQSSVINHHQPSDYAHQLESGYLAILPNCVYHTVGVLPSVTSGTKLLDIIIR